MNSSRSRTKATGRSGFKRTKFFMNNKKSVPNYSGRFFVVFSVYLNFVYCDSAVWATLYAGQAKYTLISINRN
jgi:hypothetical protein